MQNWLNVMLSLLVMRLLSVKLFMMRLLVLGHSEIHDLVRLEYHGRFFVLRMSYHLMHDNRSVMVSGHRVHRLVMRCCWVMFLFMMLHFMMGWSNSVMCLLMVCNGGFVVGNMGSLVMDNMSGLLVMNGGSLVMDNMSGLLVMNGGSLLVHRHFVVSSMSRFVMYWSSFVVQGLKILVCSLLRDKFLIEFLRHLHVFANFLSLRLVLNWLSNCLRHLNISNFGLRLVSIIS